MRYTALFLLLNAISFINCFGQNVDKVPSPTFITKPSVVKSGDNLKIDFSVSIPTDVEVAILNQKNEVVCHFVAGVIGGENKPPEPLKVGLKQNLVWDGKNDAGNKAEGGPFKVRVRLGLKPQFDSFLLDNPVATGRVTALAIDQKGSLYLWHLDNTSNGNQGGNKLKVLNRDLKYERTLIPVPADLPADKIKTIGAFTDAENNIVPRIYNMQSLTSLYEAKGNRGRAMADNISPAIDQNGRAYWLISGNRLAAMDADGKPPYETFLSEPLFGGLNFIGGSPTLCASTDGKSVYIAGLNNSDDEWGKNKKDVPCVWKVDATTRKAEVFLGDLTETGKEKNRFTAPRGLAVSKGLIYVADPSADRIAIFKESDKAFVGEIKVINPQCIGVDPKSGAVYVCIYKLKGEAELVKISGYENAKEICRLVLPKTYEFGTHRIAIDTSTQPVRIWMPTLGWQTGEIYCYEDAGEKFEVKGDFRNLKIPWAAGPRDLTVDRQRGELYVKQGVQNYYRLDVKTSKNVSQIDIRSSVGGDTAYGSQLVPSPDGTLVSLSWGVGTGLRRLNHDGKPLNWPGKDNHILQYCGIMTFMQRYLAMPTADEIFIILPPDYRSGQALGGGGATSSLNVLGLDGKTKRTVIWQCTAGASPRVDRKGNVYLAEMIKPLDRSYPKFFDDKLGG